MPGCLRDAEIAHGGKVQAVLVRFYVRMELIPLFMVIGFLADNPEYPVELVA
jgi:hypothetical protein